MPAMADRPKPELETVHRNVRAVVLHKHPSVLAFSRAKGFEQTTINRIAKGTQDPSTALLNRIAASQGFEGWMLLRADFDVKKPPAPANLSADAVAVAKALDGISDPGRRVRAYAKVSLAIIEALGESDPPSPETPRPALAPKRSRVSSR